MLDLVESIFGIAPQTVKRNTIPVVDASGGSKEKRMEEVWALHLGASLPRRRIDPAAPGYDLLEVSCWELEVEPDVWKKLLHAEAIASKAIQREADVKLLKLIPRVPGHVLNMGTLTTSFHRGTR